MSKKKVGLCLAYTGTNYGQLLQAYATQEIIRKKGFQTEIICYHSGNKKGIKFSYGAFVVAVKSILKSMTNKFKRKAEIYVDELHKNNCFQRKQQAEVFRQNYLNDVVQCNGIDQLREKSKEYIAVLVGSDQVWLPDIAVTNFFTLRFAADGVRRISYATSLGVSSYPNYVKKPAAEYWKKIDYLSVREEQGKTIIQSIVNVDVKVVADPTYLFTNNEWDDMIPFRKVIEDGYVLCYFLGDNDSIKQYARKFASEKERRLVSILSDECESNDNQFADEVLIGRSVEDFVNLIRNADYVLTDSFHGLAFSIINQKQFLVFYRKRTDVKESRNSRIDNIVRLWGIEDRLIRDPEKLNIPTNIIDYYAVIPKVNKLREDSISFLNQALKF